jgi:hypothetical protein
MTQEQHVPKPTSKWGRCYGGCTFIILVGLEHCGECLNRGAPARVCETVPPKVTMSSVYQDPVTLPLHQSLTQTVIINETPNKHFKTITFRGESGGWYKALMRIHSVMPQKTQHRLTKTTEQGPGVAKHINIYKRVVVKYNTFYLSCLFNACIIFRSHWPPSGTKYIYNKCNAMWYSTTGWLLQIFWHK